MRSQNVPEYLKTLEIGGTQSFYSYRNNCCQISVHGGNLDVVKFLGKWIRVIKTFNSSINFLSFYFSFKEIINDNGQKSVYNF